MKTHHLHFNIKAAVGSDHLETTVEFIARAVLILGILFMICAAAHGSTYPQFSLGSGSDELQFVTSFTWVKTSLPLSL